MTATDPTLLQRYGWTAERAAQFAALELEGLQPGRVILIHRGVWRIVTAEGEGNAEITGHMLHTAESAADLPGVGDWVAVSGDLSSGLYIIQQVLPRTSKFSRKGAGNRVTEQIVAANIDTVFIVVALDGDYNLRRIERYLQGAWQSGSLPHVLLTKSDLTGDLSAQVAAVEEIASGAPVTPLSVLSGAGLEAFTATLIPGHTYALLGSSGVGKSTLLNALIGGEVQKTQAVRADSRGRHTTVHRELFLLPSGALLVDTPGMRELQLWATESDNDLAAFPEIAELSAQCKYADCGHAKEPGCAIRVALEDGSLPQDRWESYNKLKGELEFVARKADKGLESAQKQKWKAIHKSMRGFKKG